MSANLLIAAAVIDAHATPDFGPAIEAARVWSPRLLSEDAYQECAMLWAELEELDGEEDERIITAIRTQLEADVRTLQAAVEDDMAPDFAWIVVRGARVWMAGGASWGDPPTEAYETLCRLHAAGLLSVAGFE